MPVKVHVREYPWVTPGSLLAHQIRKEANKLPRATLEQYREMGMQIINGKCRKHPKYQGVRKPRAKCMICDMIYCIKQNQNDNHIRL